MTADKDARTWGPELRKTRIYDALVLDIVTGALPPGAPLVERHLADARGWGVAGVREALNRLSLEGLVVRQPRTGTVVAAIDRAEVEQAFEIRSLMDARSAGLAARHATAADKAALGGAFDGAEAAIAAADDRALIAMDRAFHRAVARATHNPMLARWLDQLWVTAARWWVCAMERQAPAEQLADVRLHRDLARAVAAGDVSAAEAAMARLIGDPPSLTPPAPAPELRRPEPASA